MLRLIFPLSFLLSGCASLDDVVGGIANTPDWFQKRRVEIRGEGYPSLNDIPDPSSVLAIGTELRIKEKATREELAAFLAHPRNTLTEVTSEEITVAANELQARLPEIPLTSVEVLSETEIQALRERLQVPPVNKKK